MLDLDKVLEIMVPGKEMTYQECMDAYLREHGERANFHDMEQALVRLNYENKEGREVRHSVIGRTTWCRPILPGMGATYRIGSDRYACTIIKISKNMGQITTRDDRVWRLDNNGMSEDQSWGYASDPEGEVRVFFRDSKGLYGNKTKGGSLILGVRKHFHDFSF
jgi:hypothetical protein